MTNLESGDGHSTKDSDEDTKSSSSSSPDDSNHGELRDPPNLEVDGYRRSPSPTSSEDSLDGKSGFVRTPVTFTSEDTTRRAPSPSGSHDSYADAFPIRSALKTFPEKAPTAPSTSESEHHQDSFPVRPTLNEAVTMPEPRFEERGKKVNTFTRGVKFSETDSEPDDSTTAHHSERPHQRTRLQGVKRRMSTFGEIRRPSVFAMEPQDAAAWEAGRKRKYSLHQKKLGKFPKPVWICKMICRHPWKAFALTGCCQLSFLLLNFILYIADYDILPTNFKDAPLNIKDAEVFQRGLAWIERDANDALLSDAFDSVNIEERTMKGEGFITMYESTSGGGNVFAAENLKQIKQAEDKLMEVEDFDKYCWADAKGQCRPPISVIRFFDGTFKTLNPAVFKDNPDFNNIPETLGAALNYSITKSQLMYHLSTDWNIDASKGIAHSSVTRSLFRVGLPLEGFISPKDREDDQEKLLEDFLANQMTTALWDQNGAGMSGMRFVFNGETIQYNDRSKQITKDFALAVGSMVFIFCFVCFQTRSLFITSMAVGSIFTSFLGANLIYRIVFNYKYFGTFHLLAVFIILGIGADDVFVFYDMWRHTGREYFPTLGHRLSQAYRRASAAMLVTSLTTMIAFFVNTLSPLLMINSFGLFSGIVIFINYLSIITFFPCVVIVYHNKWENWTWPCFRVCENVKLCQKCEGSKSEEDEEDDVVAVDMPAIDEDNAEVTTKDEKGNHTTVISKKILKKKRKPNSDSGESMSSDKKPNLIIRFFSGPFYNMVTDKIIRWVILVIYVAVIVFFAYAASQIKPQSDPVKVFRDTHNYGVAQRLAQDAFVPSYDEEVVRVFVVLGMNPQDRSRCHKTDFLCKGETVWDDSFDLNPPPAQMALLNFCKSLQNLTAEQTDRMRIRRDVNGNVEIKCFLQDMENYLAKNWNSLLEKELGAPFKLPITPEKMKVVMNANREMYNTSVLTDTYYRYFETALNYWMADGFSSKRSYDYDIFSPWTGEVRDVKDTYPIRNVAPDFKGNYYGSRLRYAAVVVNTTMVMYGQGYEEGFKAQDAWQEFLDDQKSRMPPALSSAALCTPEQMNEWHWLRKQYELVKSAWQGILIGVFLALIILTLSTQNFILGIMATIVICCITTSVVGVIYLAGWAIGPLESGNLALVVGLAVDYCVHLVEGYHFSSHADRKGRVHDMLEEVGVSVFSGACTTLGASIFMLFAQIQFFFEFGLFIFTTIGFSLFYSMGLLSTILALIGPGKETGTIEPIYKYGVNYVKGRTKQDVRCMRCDGKGFYNPDADGPLNSNC